MRRGWRKVDDGLFAAVINGSKARCHLVVERLPNGHEWDWTVWRPGEPPEHARHGVAASAPAAMRAAEAAARAWSLRAPPDSSGDP